jgi:xanthine/uracil/vitamin C permease (AzgA family)
MRFSGAGDGDHVSGVLFLILSLIGLRELIFNSISPSLKNGIAAAIGLFIAFIGLQQAGVIVKDPGMAVRMNAHFASPDLIVFFVALLATACCMRVASAAPFSGASLSLPGWRVCSNHIAVHAGRRFRGA